MNSLGERLIYIRKKHGFTQDSLAKKIGVSRGVIYNLEKNKTMPQNIVVIALCNTLKINKNWLLYGTGKMEKEEAPLQKDEILVELYEAAGTLEKEEQLYILDIIKALRHRLKKNQEIS